MPILIEEIHAKLKAVREAFAAGSYQSDTAGRVTAAIDDLEATLFPPADPVPSKDTRNPL